MQTFYKEIVISKTGLQIPKLQSGKTLESIYNPQLDAQRKIQNLKGINKIILVYGMGSGILLNEILKLKPDTKIICVEYSKEDISFLSKLKTVSSLLDKIIFIPSSSLCETLVNEYLPAMNGNLQIIEQSNYLNEKPEYSEYLKNETNKAMKKISADYSVQAHFGKIWHHNILVNLKHNNSNESIKIPTDKECFILAAGPTLEDSLEILKAKESYIIATDTAYQSAIKYGIFCNAVVSLDAQNVSINHFTGKIAKDTIFLMDYSSSPSIIRKIKKIGGKICFFTTGHPLVNISQNSYDHLILNSGSGTVTIAALDFALQCGFENIKVIGADFSFPKNKSYTKGTYLDLLYNQNSSKVCSSEKQYSKLMFRTELIKRGNINTTEILESYRTSFEEFLKTRNIPFLKKQNIYEISKSFDNINKEFSIKINNKSLWENISNNSKTNAGMLPYIAFCRKQNPDEDYETLLSKALYYTKRYI